ncbi:MAG TPA: PAS domain S-box protein, partial [Methylomirabilota bacterium]|nr:PAS domain S-box protein [Methylomirabilota bacterium]
FCKLRWNPRRVLAKERKPATLCHRMSIPATSTVAPRAKRASGFRQGALTIVAIYLAFAAVWIAFSDGILSRMLDDTRVPYLQVSKNAAFAICSAILLYLLVLRLALQRATVENALRRNERRYRSLVLATAQVTWRAGASGEISEDTPTWQAFTGQTPEQYKGWGWMNAIHPEDRDHLRERWRKAIARESRPPNDRFYEIEYRVRRHDGAYRDFLSRTVPVLDARGEVSEWVGICYDITEQKLREQQLRDSEERYRSLVEVAPDMIIVHQDGKTIFMNPAGLRMLRAPNLQAVIGMAPADMVHPDYRDLVQQRIHTVGSGNPVPTIEEKLQRLDGTHMDVEVSAASFIYQGRPAVQVIARDISARLQAQEELRASEARFNMLTRATTDIVYDWDMATNAIWWNENMRVQFGYAGKPEELGMEFWVSRLHPDDVARVHGSIFSAIAEGKQFWADEYRFRRADDSYANVLDRGYITQDRHGKGVRMIGAMMDITDRKLAEQRLRDSREQMRALTGHLERVREEERTRIAREIHDELGQALTGLKMDLSWFAARLPNQPALAEKSAAMLKLIDSTVHAVRRLSTELRPAILDSLGLIPAIEWLAQEFQKRTGVQCDFVTPDDDLNVDHERTTALFRICQEALTNVARYAEATSVHIELDSHEQEITLRISDNGRGITDAEQKATKSFGLLGMRERARLLGGTFTIKGDPDEGTTLTVRIPMPQPDVLPV